MDTVELKEIRKVRTPGSKGRSSRKPMASRQSPLRKLADNSDLPLKKKLPAKRLFLLLCGACSAAILLILLQLRIDGLAAEIKVLNEKKLALQSKNRHLRQEIDRATTFDAVYPVVNEKFGMGLHSEPVLLEVPNGILTGTAK